MRNKFNIFLLLFLIFSLSSCFSGTEDANKAKEELLNGGKTIEEKLDENIVNNDKEDEPQNEIKEEKIIINYLSGDSVIELDSLKNKDLLSLEVEITGKTTTNIDKIIVNFSNTGSKFKDDNYTLKTFKAGDKTFLYRAFLKYETIDYGRNVYLIEAYHGDKISKLELIINVEKEEEKSENNLISEVLDLKDLPSNEYYGNPVDIGAGKITYSGISGLQIEKLSNLDLSLDADSINTFLSDRLSGWFFWNSLRPISDNKGVSFFVIRLEGTKFFYEKHYYTPNGFYGVIELETGDGESVSTLSDKNSELKNKNDSYVKVTISDMLFKKILN